MQSQALAFLKQRLDAEADDVARRTQAITAEVMPAAEVIAGEVVAEAKAGQLDMLVAALGQLAQLGPNGSAIKGAVDAAVAKYGPQMPQPERGVLEASAAAWEASGGPQALANLLQAVATLINR